MSSAGEPFLRFYRVHHDCSLHERLIELCKGLPEPQQVYLRGTHFGPEDEKDVSVPIDQQSTANLLV